jgi:hypothetical protein
LRRKSILGANLFYEKTSILGKTYFWKGRPNFAACTKGGKKTTSRRKDNVAHRKTCLTMIGLVFLKKIVTTISHKVV